MRVIVNFILVIGVIAVLIYPLQKDSTLPYDSYGMRFLNLIGVGGKIDTNFFKTSGDLLDFSIVKNEPISGVVEASGILKGGYFFEGNARGMILDSNKNVLKTFPVTATADWMTADGVPFTMTVDATGISAGNGYIRIANDNPSGDPTKDKFIDIPVVFE